MQILKTLHWLFLIVRMQKMCFRFPCRTWVSGTKEWHVAGFCTKIFKKSTRRRKTNWVMKYKRNFFFRILKYTLSILSNNCNNLLKISTHLMPNSACCLQYGTVVKIDQWHFRTVRPSQFCLFWQALNFISTARRIGEKNMNPTGLSNTPQSHSLSSKIGRTLT